MRPQSSGYDKGNASAGTNFVEVVPCPGKSRNGRNGDVVAEEQRCRSCTSTAAVENDVVGPRSNREVNVSLDVLRAKLETDRDATAHFSHAVGKLGEILNSIEIGKGGRRYRSLAFRNATHFGNATGVLVARQVPPVPVFAPCPHLKWKA